MLVVEDSWHDLVLMTHVLDDLKLKGRVIAVHNGTAALNHLLLIEEGKVEKPAAIFVDLALPDISGEQLIAELRGRQTVKEIPIVIFSDAPLERAQELVREFNLQGCRQKPADFGEFQKCFSELLSHWLPAQQKSRSAEGIA